MNEETKKNIEKIYQIPMFDKYDFAQDRKYTELAKIPKKEEENKRKIK